MARLDDPAFSDNGPDSGSRDNIRWPIATDLIDENAIEFEHEVDDTEEIVEHFREFLDQVSPDDFRDAEVGSDEVNDDLEETEEDDQ